MKFTSCHAENRVIWAKEIFNNYKKFITVFTYPNGELNETRCVDLNEVGVELKTKKGIDLLPDEINSSLSSVLECFGEMRPELKIV